jgi:DNA-binding MarR family transcriptional regulator
MILSNITKLEARLKASLHAQFPHALVRTLNVLGAIARLEAKRGADGPVTQGTIISECGSNRSSVCDEIRRLDVLGHVKLSGDSADRRAVVVALTDSGRCYLSTRQWKREAAYDNLFSNLTKTEREAFLALLAKVVAD